MEVYKINEKKNLKKKMKNITNWLVVAPLFINACWQEVVSVLALSFPTYALHRNRHNITTITTLHKTSAIVNLNICHSPIWERETAAQQQPQPPPLLSS